MKKINLILTIIFLIIIYIYVTYISLIPQNVILMKGEEFNLRRLLGIEITETAKTSNNNSNISNVEVRLFGKILLKDVNITTIEDIEVVPVGKIIGLKLYTNGVLVVGMSEIEDKNNVLNKPYENSDIKAGDTILKIDDNDIEDIDTLKEVVNNSNGKNLNLTILRNGSVINTSIVPVEIVGKEYKLGLWVKDAATGVGTMTFYEPVTNCFAILGHGITDSDTDNLINIDSGELVTSKIISFKKGEMGEPGEIRGTIIGQPTIGNILENSQFGVFGKLNNLTSLNIDTSKKVKVALRDEIEKIYKDNDYNNKSMLIRVTDENLIKETGGIIRGLSGAPIIQNGKFVGAVTNVLVSNPEIGYAIFGDLMIKELNKID